MNRPLALGLFAAALPTLAAAATIHVTTLADLEAADGECSLREAIVAANDDDPHLGCPAGSGADRIEFTVDGVITLGSDLPVITRDLTIAGPTPPGADPEVVVDGDGHRMFVLNGTPNGRLLRLELLRIRDGFNAGRGGCITLRESDRLELVDSQVTGCESLDAGGAIFGDLAASIAIVRSSVRNNRAAADGGGIYLLGEGYEPPALRTGVGAPSAAFRLEESTISANEVLGEASAGGLAIVWANGTIRRSTVSGNRSEGDVGGIALVYGEFQLDSLTVTANVADTDGDADFEQGAGVGLGGDEVESAIAWLSNTVISGNFAFAQPSDVVVSGGQAIFFSTGFNLVGVHEGAEAFFPLGEPNPNDDWVGDRASPVFAGLAPLGDNGGPTATHAPAPGSLLVDRGACAAELADQRGFGNLATLQRPVDNPLVPDAADGCDIGAFEADGVALPSALFLDGFESSDTGAWSASVP